MCRYSIPQRRMWPLSGVLTEKYSCSEEDAKEAHLQLQISCNSTSFTYSFMFDISYSISLISNHDMFQIFWKHDFGTITMWQFTHVVHYDFPSIFDGHPCEMCDFLLPMLAWEPAKRQSASEVWFSYCLTSSIFSF